MFICGNRCDKSLGFCTYSRFLQSNEQKYIQNRASGLTVSEGRSLTAPHSSSGSAESCHNYTLICCSPGVQDSSIYFKKVCTSIYLTCSKLNPIKPFI